MFAGAFRTGNPESAYDAVVPGPGVAVIPAFAFPREIKCGEVEVLVRDYGSNRCPSKPSNPSCRFLPLKPHAMIDYRPHEFALDQKQTAQSSASAARARAAKSRASRL